MRYARGGDAGALLPPERAAPARQRLAHHRPGRVGPRYRARPGPGPPGRQAGEHPVRYGRRRRRAPPGRAVTGRPRRVPLHFGVGRVSPPGLATGAEQLTDTLDYPAPEQIEGRRLSRPGHLYAPPCTRSSCSAVAPPSGAEQGLTLMKAQLYAAAAGGRGPRRAGLPAAVDPVLAPGAGQGSGRPVPELRPVRRGTARRARPAGLVPLRAPRAPSRERAPAGPGSGRPAQPAGVAGPSLLIAPGPREFTPPAPVAAGLPEETAGWPAGTAGRPGPPGPGRLASPGPPPVRPRARRRPGAGCGPRWRPWPWSW